MARKSARTGGSASRCGGRERGQPGETELPLLGGAHGGEQLFREAGVRLEGLAPHQTAVNGRSERPFGHFALAQTHACVALHELESFLRRGEEELLPAFADPERSADPACEEKDVRVALVDPYSSSSALALLRSSSARAKMASESTVMSSSARSKPYRAKISSSFLMIPLWIPTTEP